MSAGTRCANCGSESVEAYCGRCGQRTHRSRFALRPLLRQAADDAFNLDQGLLHTALALSRRPGRAIAEYVRGRTRPYTNPAKYLVIWAALGTFAYHYSGLLDAQLQLTGAAGDPEVAAALHGLADLLTRYFNLMQILSVPILAALSRFFFRRAGYNFAEHLIFNVFVHAQQNAIFAAALVVYVLLLPNAHLFLASYTLLAMAYYIWACRDFFPVGWLAAMARGVLINAIGQVGFWSLVGLLVGRFLLGGARG